MTPFTASLVVSTVISSACCWIFVRSNLKTRLSSCRVANSSGPMRYFFPHRTFAAFAAIWERLRGPRAAALAAPPFRPPKRPRATAAGFLTFTAGGSVFGAWPVDSSMIRYASSFGSRGRVVERSGMIPVWQEVNGCQVSGELDATSTRRG